MAQNKTFPLKQQQNDSSQQAIKQLKTSHYVPGENNGKWTQKQHLKYIAFIDFYKQKMRSKEKRRSNEFYKEMSDFIETRNGLQCRSHHQKLEEKYVYTNKIIAAFKDRIDTEEYKKCIFRLKVDKKSTRESLSMLESQDERKFISRSVQKHNVQVQTDLQGIATNYIILNHSTVGVSFPNYPIIQGQNSFFYPGSFFMPNYQSGDN